MNNILVINAGSSSIKFALYDASLRESLAGNLSEIGGQSSLRLGDKTNAVQAQDHHAALRVILAELTGRGVTPSSLTAAGHRVVHGGRDLTAPCLINPNIIAAIESCFPLAPLHNPHNMVAIRALAELAPDLPQIACFDTAFHATNAEVALRYAIPAKEDALGIRRYGFHGISFQSLVANLPGLAGTPLPRRLLAFHLGNGASICAIRDGKSEATTMGYSPLDGLTMGTRSGSIDGNAVLRLAELYGLDGAARLLNRESGLVALAGTSDMRTISARDDADARFAIAHFCYWAKTTAASARQSLMVWPGPVFPPTRRPTPRRHPGCMPMAHPSGPTSFLRGKNAKSPRKPLNVSAWQDQIAQHRRRETARELPTTKS
jgi:acetate kinase